MRKLVLGIAALVSVQFAFVTYMMVLQQPQPVELAVAPAHTRPWPERRDLVWSADVPEPEAAASPSEQLPLARRVARSATERTSNYRPSTSATNSPAFPAQLSSATSSDEFETVVISYNRNPDTSDCDMPDSPKVKKRSYLTKAMPVVKKPWEWIKSVGSKLN